MFKPVPLDETQAFFIFGMNEFSLKNQLMEIKIN